MKNALSVGLLTGAVLIFLIGTIAGKHDLVSIEIGALLVGAIIILVFRRLCTALMPFVFGTLIVAGGLGICVVLAGNPPAGIGLAIGLQALGQTAHGLQPKS